MENLFGHQTPVRGSAKPMQACFIMKSDDKWHLISVEFKALPNRMMPILSEFWSRRDAVGVIINTCGNGVKMVFQNCIKPESSVNFAMSGWYDGDQFDHSPDWSNSPVAPDKSKMVAIDYYNGPVKNEKSFDTKEQAIQAATGIHIYIWDGESWLYQRSTPDQFKRTNPWKRNLNT